MLTFLSAENVRSTQVQEKISGWMAPDNLFANVHCDKYLEMVFNRTAAYILESLSS
jgi:hypothetical protein